MENDGWEAEDVPLGSVVSFLPVSKSPNFTVSLTLSHLTLQVTSFFE